MRKFYRTTLVILMLIFICLPLANAQVTDYSDVNNWLVQDYRTKHAVDVFYLLPTTYVATTPDEQYADINNYKMRERAAKHLDNTIGIFSKSCNVFVPHYRQANALKILNQPPAVGENLIRQVPLADITAALDYYFANLNNGRPFILAGYSQGSYIMRFVLAEYFQQHPDLYKRMVAAYAVGYAIDADYLANNPHLKFAERADDTGVIISFNTEAPNLTVANPLVVPGSISINPISWTRSEKLATEAASRGALLTTLDRGDSIMVAFKGLADAQVNKARGTVICSTINIDKFSTKMLGGVFPRGVYHGYDYQLYYFDIQANVHKRIQSYLNKAAQELPCAA